MEYNRVITAYGHRDGERELRARLERRRAVEVHELDASEVQRVTRFRRRDVIESPNIWRWRKRPQYRPCSQLTSPED